MAPGFVNGYPATTNGSGILTGNIGGECIAVDPETGILEGRQDHRHNFGKAAGY